MTGPEKDLAKRLAAALAGKFEIGPEIGRGAMARVYRASRPGDPTTLAIKLLPPELAAADNAERFRREIEIVAGLRHPNILPITESGQQDGLLWYAMPFVAGATLRDVLRREGLPSIETALGLARQILDALGHAHQRGVVHRDLKPENVMVADGVVLIMDFGLARLMESTNRLTGAGMPLGTPAYMSPEQITGASEVDGRADLYGVACVLYELLTGKPPFVGTNVVELLRAHLQHPPVPPAQVRSSIPASVDAAIVRALAKAPGDRPQTAEAMISELMAGGPPAETGGQAPRRGLLRRILGR